MEQSLPNVSRLQIQLFGLAQIPLPLQTFELLESKPKHS